MSVTEQEIPEPDLEELIAAATLVWAHDQKEHLHLLTEVEAAHVVYLITLHGLNKYLLLKSQPRFVWAFNVFDNYGLDRLAAELEQRHIAPLSHKD